MIQENIAELLKRIDDLQEQIDLLRADIYGDSEETIDIETLAPVEMPPAGNSVPEETGPAEAEASEEPEREESAPEIAPEETAPAGAEAHEEPEADADRYKDYRWMTDIPGSAVSNIISGISLNDRILLINRLFGEDPVRFQTAISALNSLGSLNEAIGYIRANFPDWDLSSNVVYSFIMAIRRKLR